MAENENVQQPERKYNSNPSSPEREPTQKPHEKYAEEPAGGSGQTKIEQKKSMHLFPEGAI